MRNKFRSFGILGGDKRQLYLADSLVKDGFRVVLGGFDSLQSFGDISIADMRTALVRSEAVLLPLPPVRADGSLNAPFGEGMIVFDEDEQALLRQKPIFTAMRDSLLRAYPALKGARIYDYAARDDFAILNAVPTAEGAVACAMSAYEGTIAGTRVLVTGFGRIGKILARLLTALGARVTVSARSASDCAYIRSLGYRCCRTDRLEDVRGFQLVFNTVPALIFDRGLLQNTDRSTLLIDLASLPGGVDFDAAEALGIDARRALSLPGKCAPKTAGEIIKTTVFRMIEEVNW
ncbi:MAG: dipicolinate synthase subunit DpsA [Ruminococcus sp.]|nr:dipicolinate synthase subunit DpsA [Ruminococcus sp.]